MKKNEAAFKKQPDRNLSPQPGSYWLHAYRVYKDSDEMVYATVKVDSHSWSDEIAICMEYDLKGDTQTASWLILGFREDLPDAFTYLSKGNPGILGALSPAGLSGYSWDQLNQDFRL